MTGTKKSLPLTFVASRIARNPALEGISWFVDGSENGLKETCIQLLVDTKLHDNGDEALIPDANIRLLSVPRTGSRSKTY